MAGVLRAVGTLNAIVAPFLPPGLRDIALATAFIYGAAADALSKPPVSTGSGSKVIIDANQPMPYSMGETFVGGSLVHKAAFGATRDKVPSPYQVYVFVYSCAGPVKSIEGLYTDHVFTTASGHASGYYGKWIDFDKQLGSQPESGRLTSQYEVYGAIPGWTSTSKLSGYAAGMVGMWLDGDEDDFKYAGGEPSVGVKGEFVSVYDPRLDSTYPGGSGTQRFDDETTWSYTGQKNPALNALAYARGRYARTSGKKLIGCALPEAAIDLAAFVGWANSCDANGWELGGTVYESGQEKEKWNNLKLMAQAGGAVLTTNRQGQLTAVYDAPKTSIATITAADLSEGEHIIPGGQDYIVRKNGIIPKVRLESHQWEYAELDVVKNDTQITADGEERFERIEYTLCQDADQGGQLAAYDLVKRQELSPILLHVHARFHDLDIGEAIDVDIPELLLDHKCVVLKNDFNLDAGVCTLTLRTEDDDNHTFALGQTATVPDPPTLVASEDYDASVRGSSGYTDVLSDRVRTSFVDDTGINFVATDTTVTIDEHDRVYSDRTVTVEQGTLVGLAPDGTIYVYYDDEGRLGGAVTYGYSTTLEGAQASTDNPSRHFLGTIKTATDSGAPNNTGDFALPPTVVPPQIQQARDELGQAITDGDAALALADAALQGELDGVIDSNIVRDEIAARTGTGAITPNPTFTSYADEDGVPDDWFTANTGQVSKTAGLVSDNAARIVCPANNNTQLEYRSADGEIAEGSYFIETLFTNVSGFLNGMGVQLVLYTGGSLTSNTHYSFKNITDQTVDFGPGENGRTYDYQTPIEVPAGVDSYHLRIGKHSSRTDGNTGNTTIDVSKLYLRTARSNEAAIQNNTGAIVTAESAIATLQTDVTANTDGLAATDAGVLQNATAVTDAENAIGVLQTDVSAQAIQTGVDIPTGIEIGLPSSVQVFVDQVGPDPSADANDGEIWVSAGTFYHPTEGSRAVDAFAVLSAMEGTGALAGDGFAYLVYSDTDIETRWPSGDFGSGPHPYLFWARKDGSNWRYLDNNDITGTTFTPASTDRIVGQATKTSATTGITSFAPLFAYEDNLYARVMELSQALANVEGYLEANKTLTVSAGGALAQAVFRAFSTGTLTQSDITLLADKVSLLGGGTLFQLDNSGAILNGVLRITGGGTAGNPDTMVAIAPDFGADGDLILWAGPYKAPSLCKKTAGDMAIAADGFYIAGVKQGGGSQQDSQTTTSTAGPTLNIDTVQLDSNGNDIDVGANYSFTSTKVTSSETDPGGSTTPTGGATIKIYRKIDAGSFTEEATVTVTGSLVTTTEGTGIDTGPYTVTDTFTIMADLAYLETSSVSTEDYTWRASLTSRTLPTGHLNYEQELTISSFET